VDQPVHEVEADLPKKRDEQHQHHEPDRVRFNVIVGMYWLAISQSEITSKAVHTARRCEGPEHVVEDLVPEQGTRVVAGLPAVGVLVAGALPLPDVEREVEGADEEKEHHRVAGEDRRDPPGSKVCMVAGSASGTPKSGSRCRRTACSREAGSPATRKSTSASSAD
jgi:hypothetical protein